MVKKFSSDKAFYFFVTVILAFTTIIILYPLWWILCCSFSSGAMVSSGQVFLWPKELTFDGYKAILDNGLILSGYRNTIFYTICGTAINVSVTLLAAFPLSCSKLAGRDKITLFFAFTMWFNGGMIPTYLLYKQLGLINSPLVMIIPGALGVWYMVITRTYFQKSIPEELMEASKLDGCSDFQYLLSVALPLAKPIIAVITLYYAVGHWNAFFNAMIYLNKSEYFPLQLVLRDILIAGQEVDISSSGYSIEDLAYRENLQNMLQYSIIIAASAPMLALYPFIQKYFEKGIMVGALKG